MKVQNSTSRPLLSVITVSFRDIEGLRRTLNSVLPLVRDANGLVEVVVQDGGTGPELDTLKAEFNSPLVRIESAPDEGIYDGMNRALVRSRGDFVWFLNGGDEAEVHDWSPLRNLLQDNRDKIVLCAYRLDLGSHVVEKQARSASYLWHALPTSHQAVFYPGAHARRTLYDLSYRVAGDYAFTASLYSARPVSVRSGLLVARFATGGMSQNHAKIIAQEARRVQREILRTGRLRQFASRARHFASRTLRQMRTTPIVRHRTSEE